MNVRIHCQFVARTPAHVYLLEDAKGMGAVMAAAEALRQEQGYARILVEVK